jgi:4-diphosphocytidyl-2-C-methyl-D-erythritol kinase
LVFEGDDPRRCSIRTPAKINLGLRVLGKRPDGFHEIETLFIALDLYDELRFERRNNGGVRFGWRDGTAGCRDQDIGADSDNLVVRAVRLVERDCGAQFNLDIDLEKNIPVAAGLGGGSSDAAATLIALSTLHPELVRSEALPGWALELGSDVPFFLGEPVAIGRGRGERLSSASINTTFWVVLVCPPLISPTGSIYQALDLTYLPKMPHFPASLDGDGLFAALGRIHNDLQDVVIRRFPDVSSWLEWLKSLGAEGAYVSGSGPTVFGVFRNRPPIDLIEAQRVLGVKAFLVRPVDTPKCMVIGLS